MAAVVFRINLSGEKVKDTEGRRIGQGYESDMSSNDRICSEMTTMMVRGGLAMLEQRGQLTEGKKWVENRVLHFLLSIQPLQ